jgi:hypothetical protein
MAGSSSSFRGPECWRRVHRPHTEVVAVDAATAATHRWTSGARGRGVGSVWGNGRRGRPCLSGGLSAGGVFIAHTPKSSPSTPPPPPLIGGQMARAVKGLGWRGGTDGMVVSSFRGPKCWRHVCCPHTKVVAIDAATTATHRWTDGMCGQGIGLVWGNRRHGRPCLSGGPSAGGAFVAHTPKLLLSMLPPLPLIGGRAASAVEGSGRCGGTDGGVVLVFQGARVLEARSSPTHEGVAVDAATAATHRWTSGARGRGVVSVWGNGRQGRPRLSGGPSAGGAFVAHTPKSSPSTPPPPPLIGGRTVRAVEGSDGCGEADGMWWSSSFSGAGVGARETSVVSAWVSD